MKELLYHNLSRNYYFFLEKNLMKVQVLEPFYRFAVDLFFDPNQVFFFTLLIFTVIPFAF